MSLAQPFVRSVPPAVCAAILVLLWAGGCGTSSPTAPTAMGPPTGDVVYAALGASDTTGFGGSAPCVPFTECPNGGGYVQTIARELGRTRKVTLSNLGIPAAVLSPRIQAIGLAHGRDVPANILERGMRFVPPATNLVTIFIGGNDVNAVATAVERGAGGGDPRAYISAEIAAFGADYATLIAGIRDRAPASWIVLANLPNFAGVPFAASYSTPRKQVLQRLSVGFSQEINRLARADVKVVDLLCDARSYNRSTYSSDGFHPSDSGYAFFASEMLAAIASADYRTPRASCGRMTIVPAF